jgi:hypothetical protein
MQHWQREDHHAAAAVNSAVDDMYHIDSIQHCCVALATEKQLDNPAAIAVTSISALEPCSSSAACVTVAK